MAKIVDIGNEENMRQPQISPNDSKSLIRGPESTHYKISRSLKKEMKLINLTVSLLLGKNMYIRNSP